MTQKFDNTNAPTVKPEVGKRYRVRDGREALVTGFDSNTPWHRFSGTIDGRGNHSWTSKGDYWSNCVSYLDLIEEITEPVDDEPEQLERIEWYATLDRKGRNGSFDNYDAAYIDFWEHGGTIYRITTDYDGSNPEIEEIVT